MAKTNKGMLPTPDGAQLPYLMLGEGRTPLVIIPGAGDGLTTVYQGALQLALFYRKRRKDFRMLLLSRRQPIPARFTMQQHADDMLFAIDQLGWPPSVLELNSAGGPIGQWMAVKRPDWVRGLVLSVTLHRTVESSRRIFTEWMQLAENRRWGELNWSSIEHTFRPKTVARYRPFRFLLRLMPPPKHPQRLPRIFASLLDLDNRPILPQIACPALVIGGEDDRVIPAEVQREMAALIPNSRLVLYPGYGHGNDQENPDYELQVRKFLGNVFPDVRHVSD